nr:zinc phosphodiesterase elac protein 1 [Hymenolepis microstoma]
MESGINFISISSCEDESACGKTARFFRDIFDKANGVKDDRSNFVAHAFMLDHRVPCVGYLFLEPSPLPTLLADKAIALGVKPGPLMGKLKAGQSVTFERDGRQVTVSPLQVLGPQKRGRRVAILGDSRNSSELRRLLRLLCLESRVGKTDQKGENFECKNGDNGIWRLDCLVHEATGHSVEQGDKSMADKGHSTARSAAAFAATIGTRQLVLNHFSQRFINDEVFLSQGKDPVNYSKVSSLLEDAKSCEEFEGEVHLSDDLKIIPIVGNVEDGDDLEFDAKLQAQ